MADRRFGPQRRDRWRRPVTFVLGRSQGNAFIPWADLESKSCASVANLRPPHPVQTPSSVEGLSIAPLATKCPSPESSHSKSFIPSVNENYYTAEEKQALYLPPLYGQTLFYAYKHHEIKIEPLNAVFKGRNFLYLVLRNLLQSIGPFVEYWKKQVEEENAIVDSDDEDEVQRERMGPPPNMEEQMEKCWRAILRELAVGATKKVLAFWAVEHMERRTAWKLTKDLNASAVRKSGRGLGRLSTSWRMFATASRGYLLFLAASWLVQFGVDAYDCYHYADQRQGLCVLAKRMKRNTLRNLVYLVAFALGASVGTFLWPGKGTLVGTVLGPLAGEVAFPFVEMKMKSLGDGNGLDLAPL
ncbi:hypothetical protein KFL_002030170 [Klebsormidium nitens]|uniref:Uncharacterized protein n=1 Tax=Klebsormidium nitens TaxID=105231 RepID=A0A1Y1I1F2_KLENI|nr:hypothetical protein KFL_002030170 [Klebsormidium nitens]|eukprot:GAQ84735.1 hypothetical protein KFL_002030170 [Klebsormidium nitens]